MPSLFSEPSTSIVPVSSSPLPTTGADNPPIVFPIRHLIKPRSSTSTSAGPAETSSKSPASAVPPKKTPAATEPAGRCSRCGGGGGGAGDGEEVGDDAERRRIAYGSVPPFSLLQGRKNLLMAAAATSTTSLLLREWWQYVLEYSNSISNLLGASSLPSGSVIEV